MNSLRQAHLYPDGGGHDLRGAIAHERGVSEESVLVGNGSNEIIELLGHAFLRPGVEVVMGRRHSLFTSWSRSCLALRRWRCRWQILPMT